MEVQTQQVPLGQMKTKPKVAIAGMGMVGGALEKCLDNPILYDPPKGIGSVAELNEADIVFVCVPTPYKEGFDLSFVISLLDELEDGKIVVLKSTILPGTTDHLQKEYPQHKFLFNPEFLTEATADQDARYPDRQILGYTQQSYTSCTEVMNLLPLAPCEKIMPAKEAEMVKYFNNTWFATKVIFANQMYDLCHKLDLDYDRLVEAAAADKRIGRTHLNIFHKGYRGYGGKCLPKDIDAFSNKFNISLLKQVKKINDELLKEQ